MRRATANPPSTRPGPTACASATRARIAAAARQDGLLTGDDGKVHPRAIFDAIAEVADPDYIAIADGGDLLSFARTGLQATTYMDAGAFGCLGVGVPFAVAAALALPGRQVISVNGDGAFGINAMEIDTAVRHGAKAVFIVSNNAAWNIERLDQEMNYGGRVVGTTLRHSDYAAMARALGLHGERVEKAGGFAGACNALWRTRRRWSMSSPRRRSSRRTRRRASASCRTIRHSRPGTRRNDGDGTTHRPHIAARSKRRNACSQVRAARARCRHLQFACDCVRRCPPLGGQRGTRREALSSHRPFAPNKSRRVKLRPRSCATRGPQRPPANWSSMHRRVDCDGGGWLQPGACQRF